MYPRTRPSNQAFIILPRNTPLKLQSDDIMYRQDKKNSKSIETFAMTTITLKI